MYSHELLLSYKNLIFQLILSISLTFLLHFFSLSSLFINGLNTYIHPDDVNPSKPQQSAPKIAIKRPSSDQNPNNIPGFQSRTSSVIKQRKKIREKFEFDESKAQIFRLKLGDLQIQSRLFYDDYKGCFNCFVVFGSCFLLQKYLNLNDDYDDVGVVKDGSLVPISIGVFGLIRVLVSGFRVSIERSAFKRVERQLGLVISVLGFFVALVICIGVYPGAVDFDFESINGFGKLVLAIVCGCITGFLYLGAGKNARAFWLGTDQIRCNLSIVSCGWFAQIMFYANYLLLGFTSLLWIKPFGDVFMNKGKNVTQSSRLIDNVGMSEADFHKFRLCCMLLTGLFQVLVLRLNVQTFLNEAVLSWYQRLHSSTVPDTEYSRAKVFLHNHYLCLAAVQFLAPAALTLISLGLSQVDGGLFDKFEVIFAKDASLFVAWWVAFVWFVFSSVYLAMFRRGVLHMS